MRAQITLRKHARSETLGVNSRWLGLANSSKHGGPPVVHIRRFISYLYYIPILDRIAIRILAHEVQHAAGDDLESIHHDRPVYTALTGKPMHECGMSTTVKNDTGSRKGKINWKTMFTYKHLSPWAIVAAHELYQRGSTMVELKKGSELEEYLNG